jgi:hypothetical protein
LPAELRKKDRLRAGQKFEVFRLKEGEYLLKCLDKPTQSGLAELLLNCPVKDWFCEIESESTDTLN